MPRDFKIFYGENIPDEITDHVQKMLQDLFGLQFRIVGIRIPRKNTWIDAHNAYDARILLNNVVSDGLTFILWLIEPPLILDNEKVFGFAETIKGAIVSISKMSTRTLAAKEAAFQVGIVLGLKECKHECLMASAKSFEDLIRKPSTLCNTCNLKYQRLKIRYG